jgi:DNA-binding transcriptional LysR family regulator
MKIRDFETFALVANLGSITRAAAELNIAQPAVSRTVAGMEDYFGTKLLHRTGRGVATTQAGKTALVAIEAFLTNLAETRDSLRAAQGIVSGRITVGITPMVGQTIVAEAIDLMRSDHPEVELRVLEGNGTAIINWLGEGTVDLALTYIPPAQIGDHELAEVLVDERLCLITNRTIAEDVIPFATVCSGALVLPGRDSGMRRHLDKLASARGLALAPEHQIDSFPTCIGLALEGMADTIAPEMAVRSLVVAGAVNAVPIVEPEIAARLSVHRSSKGPMTRAAKGFLSALKFSRDHG